LPTIIFKKLVNLPRVVDRRISRNERVSKINSSLRHERQNKFTSTKNFLKGNIMKALVMIGLVAMSSIALANGGGGGGGGNPTTQTSVIMHTSVWNTSDGSGSASEQNLASNAGTFTNSNTLSQTVNAKHSLISNDSYSGGRATQNIASNAGTSGLYTTTHQLASITHSSVINRASWNAQAIQNISSNTNCITCLNSSSGSGHGHGHGN
jgi:hypothetical protein